MRAGEIAKALGGEVRGRHIYAPGPGHSRADRSMWIMLDFQAPDGFLAGSFAGDDWAACKDYVKERLGLFSERADCTARRKRLYEELHPETRSTSDGGPGRNKETRRQLGDDIADRFTADTAKATGKSELARDIAKSSLPIEDTIAEIYLKARIGSKIEWPSCLRFHPHCPRGNERLPALICIMRDAKTDEFAAIQRIFLQPDGKDRLRDARGKMTLGPAAGAVVKLSCDDEVTLGLGIAEGIEKALALMALGWRPIWATCGASTLANFPVLAGIEALTIFADPDEAGQKAAAACAQRWADAGRETVIRVPRGERDWSAAVGGF